MATAFRWRGQGVRPLPKVSRTLVIFSCVGSLLMTGCPRPNDSSSAVTVEHTISPEPPRVGSETITLKLADIASRPISGARVILEADMSHAGMAPVLAEAKEIEPGLYQAALRLAMAGDWVILLHVQLTSGQTVESQFNVDGVRPN